MAKKLWLGKLNGGKIMFLLSIIHLTRRSLEHNFKTPYYVLAEFCEMSFHWRFIRCINYEILKMC